MAWQSWFYAKHPVVIPTHLAGSVGTIAITAFVLGTLVGGCLPGVLVLVRHLLEQSEYLAWLAPLQRYLLVWSCFHFLEFVVTAYWNPIHLQSDCTYAVGPSRVMLTLARAVLSVPATKRI